MWDFYEIVTVNLIDLNNYVIHIDLCDINNGGCEHVCTNTRSGVSCSCSDGYQLMNKQDCTGK